VKDFSRWPLDGLVVFIGCIIGVICLLGARLVDRPAFHVAKPEGGAFRMKPLPSAAVTGIAFILNAVLISYAVSKGEHHSNNHQLGMLVAAVLWVIAIYFLYANYLVRYAFNDAGFQVTDLFRRVKTFPWESLVALGHPRGDPVLYFSNKAFRVPHGRRGRRQLICLVDSRVLRMQSPLLPVYDDDILQELIGKTGIVSLLKSDETHHPLLVSSRVGTLDSVGFDRVTVRFEDGTRLGASANLRSIRPGNKKSTWIASWYVNDHDSCAAAIQL